MPIDPTKAPIADPGLATAAIAYASSSRRRRRGSTSSLRPAASPGRWRR